MLPAPPSLMSRPRHRHQHRGQRVRYLHHLTGSRFPTASPASRGTCFACTGLTNVTIPDSVTNIGDYAFADCSSLSSVQIPRSVISLGVQAFAQCASLTNVYFEGNAPAVSVDQYAWPGGIDVSEAPPTRWDITCREPPVRVCRRCSPGCPWFCGPLRWRPTMAVLGCEAINLGSLSTGPAGTTVVVEAATNLADPVWYPLQTNTLSSGSFYFSDAQWTNYPTRFYRYPGNSPNSLT